jgi:hypothetical protein
MECSTSQKRHDPGNREREGFSGFVFFIPEEGEKRLAEAIRTAFVLKGISVAPLRSLPAGQKYNTR